MIRGYAPERIFAVVLMLRVWVMYNKSKNLGMFLGALFAVAFVASMILPLMQPPVSWVTFHTTQAHSDTLLDRHRSNTILYDLGPHLTPPSLMSSSPYSVNTLCAITPNRFAIPSSQISRFDTRVLFLAYFWLIITALSVEVIAFSLFCVRVYIAWKDSMTTPILSALFTQ
jgi:hypothetical protein